MHNLKSNKVTLIRIKMDELLNVLLAIYKAHRGTGLWTSPRWIKPGLWAQPPDSLCLAYIWQVYHFY